MQGTLFLTGKILGNSHWAEKGFIDFKKSPMSGDILCCTAECDVAASEVQSQAEKLR